MGFAACQPPTTPTLVVSQLSGDGGTPVVVHATGDHFTPGGSLRIDVHNAATNHTFQGWATASGTGAYVTDVTIPPNELVYCGLTCGYNATLSVVANQLSAPPTASSSKSITVHSVPTFTAWQSGGVGTDPVTLTASGAGWVPNTALRIDVFNPTNRTTISAWTEAGSGGTFSGTATIPHNQLVSCGDACGWRANVSVSILQWTPPQYQSPSVGVSLLAKPAYQFLQGQFWTGADDKRDDSQVSLEVQSTTGSQTFVLSPLNETLKANTNKSFTVALSPQLEESGITGYRLIWDGGEGDGIFSYHDEWDFAGIDISGWNGTGWVHLFDNGHASYHFKPDLTLQLKPASASLSVPYTLTVFGDLGTSASVSLNPSGPNWVATIPAGLTVDSCGQHPVPAGSITFTGNRTVDGGTGTSHYTLNGGPIDVGSGYTATLTVEGDLSADGSRFAGTVKIDANAPVGCGDRTFTFSGGPT